MKWTANQQHLPTALFCSGPHLWQLTESSILTRDSFSVFLAKLVSAACRIAIKKC